MSTLAAQGYRMPAEWEAHAATWLTFPHNPLTWPGKLAAVQQAYARMVAALAPSEPVHILVQDANHATQVQQWLAEAGAQGEIHLHILPTNEAWIRDNGAIFVCHPQPAADQPRRLAIQWQFNAWGNKYPHLHDHAIPPYMAQTHGVPVVPGGMVLEGGSIEVNGNGVLLTTEACLLHPNRNPHLSRAQIEQRLRDMLGVELILWLGAGIEGDDTDGHVDDLTRFVSTTTIVTAVEDDPNDVNYAALQANLRRLQAMTDQHGQPFRIITLPMPPAVVHEGIRLPASYANFYIANRVVLLPTYRHPATDEQAQQIVQACFPERTVIGVDSTDIVWGRGSFHCLTQQVPA